MNTGTRRDVIDVLVLGDLNADLTLTGADLVPRFGQVETLVDDAGLVLGSSGGIFASGAASGLTVNLNRGPDRAILTHLGGMAEMTASRMVPDLLARARHVHVTSYFLQRGVHKDLPELLSQAKKNGATTSLDTNWDPAEPWDDGIHEVLLRIDTFLPNAAEAMALTGTRSTEAAAEALSRTVPDVVIKRGAEGAYAICGGVVCQEPAPRAAVLDTTGAGDSFDAGYVFGLLSGLPIAERLRVASLCGARSTEGLGGVTAQITGQELRSALSESPS